MPETSHSMRYMMGNSERCLRSKRDAAHLSSSAYKVSAAPSVFPLVNSKDKVDCLRRTNRVMKTSFRLETWRSRRAVSAGSPRDPGGNPRGAESQLTDLEMHEHSSANEVGASFGVGVMIVSNGKPTSAQFQRTVIFYTLIFYTLIPIANRI